MDLMGFDKDRTWWYRSWFPTINEPVTTDTVLHTFVSVSQTPASCALTPLPTTTCIPLPPLLQPHWNWQSGQNVDIWSYSNAASVELFVNGASLGRKNMTRFAHVEWDKVPFVAGSFTSVAYDASGAAVASKSVNTTGAPVALRATIRDGYGAQLLTTCFDFGLVMVEVVDANGLVVPYANNSVTISTSGLATAWVEGTGNGDPAGGENNKSPTHAAFHGLLLGVIGSGDVPGTITVTASSPGLTPSSVEMPVVDGTGTSNKWCSGLPQW
jgi:beta-galactosidase